MQINGITATDASKDLRLLLRKQTFQRHSAERFFAHCEVFTVSVCQVQNVGLSTTE